VKILILTDERYQEIYGVLATAGAHDLLEGVNAPPKLPKARELHELARNGGEPEAFAQTRERQEAVGFASDRVREQLHKLILDAYALGVPPGKLAKWSGYSPRRIHQITND
jgi:hypothetical protein